ncbi:hypothetical protein BT63DRAFT_363267, partial [Microthyrium microscopicum]
MVRIKHRYLLINILYPGDSNLNQKPHEPELPNVVQFHQPCPFSFKAQDLRRLIMASISENFGEYGSAATNPSLQVKYFSQATSTAIVRVHREHFRLVWAAVTMITKLPKSFDTPCVLQVVRVSGTIKKAEEEAIRR